MGVADQHWFIIARMFSSKPDPPLPDATPTPFLDRVINSWKEFVEFCSDNTHGDNWSFRGQGRASWGLKTSLERAVRGLSAADDAEEYSLRCFKRYAHHYVSNLPSDDDMPEWLALMQHFGAPTRLLDFTRSPYVALYFALKDLVDGDECAVWAVNHYKCKENTTSLINAKCGAKLNELHDCYGHKDQFNLWFKPHKIKLVCPMRPSRMNERLMVQQGLFLCPGDLRDASFESNLSEVLNVSSGQRDVF